MEAMRRLREAHRQYQKHLDDWFINPSLEDRLRGLLVSLAISNA
jgi:hypothetical protein